MILESQPLDVYANFSQPLISFPYLAALILISLPVAALVGFRLGVIERRRRNYGDLPPERVPGRTSLGAMLALLGLLLGFAFSATLNWREARQSALVDEAAALSSAFLTVDLLQDPGRTDLKNKILVYTKTRLASEDDIRTPDAWNAFLKRTLEAQLAIWPATMAALTEDTPPAIRASIVRSVTTMFDAHTRRVAAAAEQLPETAKAMIFLASLVAIMIAGNRSALQGRPLTWRTFLFAGFLSVVIIVIVDLDRSLEGMIRLNPDTLLAAVVEMERALDATPD